MTPVDLKLSGTPKTTEIKGSAAGDHPAESAKERIVKIVAGGADEALPPCWQGASPAELLMYGPKAAVFERPPEQNPEPPEPEEEVGAALTERQLAFCEHYIGRPVAALAARAAGYAPATASKQASRLLKQPAVIRHILELRRKRHLEQAYRRETLIDKLEVVFSEAIERREFYAAIQALTMQARLSRIDEAMPGFRYVSRYENGREQLLWDALNRLEQKLSELAVGDFPGAAAAVPQTSFEEGARAERWRNESLPPSERAAYALEGARRAKRRK